VTVQRRFRIMYHTEPPTDKTIREWYMKFQQSGCLCAAKRTGRRPGPSAETVERVRETFVRSPQKSPRVHISSTCKVGQKLGVSLSLLICSFLPCLSWLLRSRARKSRRDLWITLYNPLLALWFPFQSNPHVLSLTLTCIALILWLLFVTELSLSQVGSLMSSFSCLLQSKASVQVRGCLFNFVTCSKRQVNPRTSSEGLCSVYTATALRQCISFGSLQMTAVTVFPLGLPCVSVCSLTNDWDPVDGFSLYLVFGNFTRISYRIPVCLKFCGSIVFTKRTKNIERKLCST